MARSKVAKFVDRGRVSDDVKLEVELLLSPSPAARRDELMSKLAESYYEVEPATRARFAMEKLYRAPPALLERVKGFARQNGLTIVDSTGVSNEDELPSRVKLRGTAGQMTAAFNFRLHWFSAGPSRYMAPANASTPSLPPGIAEFVVGILGFDLRPIIAPTKGAVEFPDDEEADPKRLLLSSAPSAPGHLTAVELAALYNFPPGLDGTGQKIGVILTDGGMHQSALDTYLQCLRLGPRTVEIVNVRPAKNNPSSLADIHGFLLSGGLGSNAPLLPCSGLGTGPTRPTPSGRPADLDQIRMLFTLEAMIDSELIASVANGAGLRLYFTPDDILGIRQAIEKAVIDKVDVLILPWGFAERTPGLHWIQSINWALAHAVQTRDMTILCSSGNYGSTPSRFERDRLEAVYPASSPWVVACGGTALQSPSPGGTVSEAVWNEQNVPIFGHLATGGGHSSVFKRPKWQTANSSTRRGVPDLSISAAFATGLWAWFGSANGVALGTSASAAILGGLVARINQGLGRRVGLLTPLLYDSRVQTTMRRLSRPGNNSVNRSVTHHVADPVMIWNPCTGLGSPDGVQLLSSLQTVLSELEPVAGLAASEAFLLAG